VSIFLFFSLQQGRGNGGFCTLLLQEIHNLNHVFYVSQKRIGMYKTLTKDTAMKHLVRPEDVTKAVHTHSDHSDIRNAKLEFHFQNLS
jgi:hypothetical protein